MYQQFGVENIKSYLFYLFTKELLTYDIHYIIIGSTERILVTVNRKRQNG